MRRTQPWLPGTPCWLDVMTPDPEATRRFYGDLFGWVFGNGGDDGDYAIATLDGAAVAGVIVDAEHPPVWNLYLAVDDLAATNTAVAGSGGEVIAVKDASGGRLSLCREPTGAFFCLWQAGTDIGCEIVNEPGAFVWAELLTRDYEDAKRFHTDTFAVGLTEIGGDTFDFATIDVAGATVGGIGRMSDVSPPEAPPHWRLYFLADDTDAVVAHAVSGGASVATEAHDTPFGRWAALADPLGARFCVITPPGA